MNVYVFNQIYLFCMCVFVLALMLFTFNKGFIRKVSTEELFFCVCLGIALFLSVCGFLYFSNSLDVNGTYNPFITTGEDTYDFPLAVVITPIYEEIVFRAGVIALLINVFKTKDLPYKNVFLILVQSLIFSAFHVDVMSKIYSYFAGVLLGFIYMYRIDLRNKRVSYDKNLLRPIIVHITFNLASALVYYSIESLSHI